MTLSTHYTKDALESIFATAQNAEFMGLSLRIGLIK